MFAPFGSYRVTVHYFNIRAIQHRGWCIHPTATLLLRSAASRAVLHTGAPGVSTPQRPVSYDIFAVEDLPRPCVSRRRDLSAAVRACENPHAYTYAFAHTHTTCTGGARRERAFLMSSLRACTRRTTVCPLGRSHHGSSRKPSCHPVQRVHEISVSFLSAPIWWSSVIVNSNDAIVSSAKDGELKFLDMVFDSLTIFELSTYILL